jgi:hypothetical protein
MARCCMCLLQRRQQAAAAAPPQAGQRLRSTSCMTEGRMVPHTPLEMLTWPFHGGRLLLGSVQPSPTTRMSAQFTNSL